MTTECRAGSRLDVKRKVGGRWQPKSTSRDQAILEEGSPALDGKRAKLKAGTKKETKNKKMSGQLASLYLQTRINFILFYFIC